MNGILLQSSLLLCILLSLDLFHLASSTKSSTSSIASSIITKKRKAKTLATAVENRFIISSTRLDDNKKNKKSSNPTSLLSSFILDNGRLRGGDSSSGVGSSGGTKKKKKTKKSSTTATDPTTTTGKKKKKKKKNSSAVVAETETEAARKEEQQVITDAMKEKDAAEAFGDAIRTRASVLTKTDYLESINRSIQSLGMALGASDRREQHLLLSSNNENNKKGKKNYQTPLSSSSYKTSSPTTTTNTKTTSTTTTTTTDTDVNNKNNMKIIGDNDHHTTIHNINNTTTVTITNDIVTNDDDDELLHHRNDKKITVDNYAFDDDDDDVDDDIHTTTMTTTSNDDDDHHLGLDYSDDDDNNMHNYVDIDIVPTTVIASYFMKSHGGVHILQCLCSGLASLAGLGCIVISKQKPLCLTLLKRCMLFAMMKHISGLLAATVLAARAIPEIGLRNAKLWIEQLILDPVSQYVFYTACVFLWLPTKLSTAATTTKGILPQQVVWDRVPWIQWIFVGPILLREIVSTVLVVSDVLVLSATCSSNGGGSSTIEQLIGLAKPMMDRIMKVLLASSSDNNYNNNSNTPMIRQAMLAKGISKLSLLFEFVVGVLFLVQGMISVVAFFFAPHEQRPKFLQLLSSLLCTHAYVRFLWIRSNKKLSKE